MSVKRTSVRRRRLKAKFSLVWFGVGVILAVALPAIMLAVLIGLVLWKVVKK